MSCTPEDAEYEIGLDLLYDDFKKNYEPDLIVEKVCIFYEENEKICEIAALNLTESKELMIMKHYSASFLHSIIALEVAIKTVVLKPILFSLSSDSRACQLLFDLTFKRKSIPQIPAQYFEILREISNIDFKNKKRDGESTALYSEIKKLQELRNEVVHQGIFIDSDDARKALDVASHVLDVLIPQVLGSYGYHVSNNIIASRR